MNGDVAQAVVEGEQALLVKPQTFMNLSGDSVGPLLRYYRLGPEDLLVVYDDLDLPDGSLKVRTGGGAGGHRGMQSVITSLGTRDFARVRMGIGRPPAQMTSAEYVLQSLTKSQRATFDESVSVAVSAIRTWVREGVTATMNKYNGTMP